ncbi:MAG: copper chaperone PCu(A)C [Caldimonas sp.]
MTRLIRRRGLLQAGCALGLALAAPALRAHEFFTGNLTVIHPWTRASSAGATSAIVSMTFEDVVRSDRLVGVQTPVAARAELGGLGAGAPLDFAIPEGRTSTLTETGVHLRLLDLQFPLLQGREYPMTLVFAEAGPIRAALLVDYAAA